MHIEETELEKKELEERCSEFVNEIESAQDLRKKVEKNYQEELKVLNNKIQQLNQYIEEIETKNNEKLRFSLTGEVSFCFLIKNLIRCFRNGRKVTHQQNLEWEELLLEKQTL